MRTTIAVLASLLLLGQTDDSLSLYPDQNSPVTSPAVADQDLDGNAVCGGHPTTDTAPGVTVARGRDALATGSTATGGDTYLLGGEGRATITVDTSGTKEVGVTVTQICHGIPLAALTEGLNYHCSGLTDAVCAANLAVAIQAQSGSCVTATSSGAVVYPQPLVCDGYGVHWASANGGSGGTAFTVTNGADGAVILYGDVLNRLVATDTSATFGVPIVDTAGITLGATMNATGNSVTNVNDLYDSTAQATDVDATPNTAIGSAVPTAIVGAGHNLGSNICPIPASGNNQLTGVSKNGTDGDTITITAMGMDCTVTQTILTEGDGTGGTYECNGAASDVACVTNLAAVAVAAASAGKFTYVAAAGTETGLFASTPGTSLWVGVVPSDATNTVIAQGRDGQILLAPGDNSGATVYPNIAAVWDTDTGFGITFTTSTVGQPYMGVGGVRNISCGTGSVTFAAGQAINIATGYLYSSANATDFGAACAPVGVADATGNECHAGEVYFADRMASKVETLADGATAPDVSGSNFFITPANTNPTAISDLTNPIAGQQVTICIGSATNPSTIADAGNFNLNAAWNPGLDDCIRLFVQADNDYIEMGRVDN
jgi:hypothetical protein